MFDELTTLARDAVTSAGYAGLVAAMAAENLIPPIPSEIVLPLAGYETSRGDLVFVWVVVAATAGSLIGALVLYAIGRYGGRPFVDRWGRVLRITPRDLRRAETWFDRWGDWVAGLAAEGAGPGLRRDRGGRVRAVAHRAAVRRGCRGAGGAVHGGRP